MILSDDARIQRYEQSGLWGDYTCDALFQGTAQAHQDQLALADAPNRDSFAYGDAHRLTYFELDGAVERLARTFLGLGLRRDDIIALQMPNVVEQMVVFLAAWRVGLIVSPLPVMWREYELKAALPIIAPRAIITMSTPQFDHVEMMRNAAFDLMTIRFVLGFGPDLPDGVIPLNGIFHENSQDLPQGYDPATLDLSANDIALITWAGGDCPAPCPVPRSHNQLLAAGRMAQLEAGIADRSVILNPYPLISLVPLGCFAMPWLLTGGALILHHPFDLSVFAKQITRENVAFTGMPPSVIDVVKSENIFQSSNEESGLKAVAAIWPAPILPADAQERVSNLGINLIDVRNVNEMVLVIRQRREGVKPALIPHGNWKSPDGSDAHDGLLDARVKGSTLVNKDAGSLLGGDLLVQSPMMFDEYYPPAIDGAPRPILSRDHAGYTMTGHKCTLIGGAEAMIEPIERDSGTIIHGGIWISAQELDVLYAQHDGLSDAAAFTFDDPVMGERIMAAVVQGPGRQVTLNDFRDYLCDQNIAAYKIPDRLVQVKTIPRNDRGDVLRDQVLEDI